MKEYDNDYIGMPHAPAQHQRAIKNIMAFIDEHGEEGILLTLSETPLGDGARDAVPDVVVFDEESEEVLLVVEVELRSRMKATVKRMRQYLTDNEIGEGFLFIYSPEGTFNYDITNIYRVTPEGYQEDTFSTVLDMDFEEFLERK